MCGRYALNVTPAEMRNHFGDLVADEHWQPFTGFTSYNISPSQSVPVLRYSKSDQRFIVDRLVWGFRPSSLKKRWINAPAEKLFSMPLLKSSAAKRRCLVPATGWYEWQTIPDRPKQPYYAHFDGLFAFAGIWTARENPIDTWEINFAIVTTAARGPIKPIHPRMPLVLNPAHYAAWIDPTTATPQALLTPVDSGMDVYPISTWVNKPENDDVRCVAPL